MAYYHLYFVFDQGRKPQFLTKLVVIGVSFIGVSVRALILLPCNRKSAPGQFLPQAVYRHVTDLWLPASNYSCNCMCCQGIGLGAGLARVADSVWLQWLHHASQPKKHAAHQKGPHQHHDAQKPPYHRRAVVAIWLLVHRGFGACG